MNNTIATPIQESVPNLLGAFDSIQVRNEEKLSAADREFCLQEQQTLYASLDQLQRWYDLLRADADRYAESHNVEYKANGAVDRCKLRSLDRTDYHWYEFQPFDALNAVVEKNISAIREFGQRIVNYFNRTYTLTVDTPTLDEKEIPMGHRPEYTTYVDRVIGYLGGRGFRATAEQEIMEGLGKTVVHRPDWGRAPEVKATVLSFFNILSYDDFYKQHYDRNHLHYSSGTSLNTVCTGVALLGAERLNGNSKIVQGLNTDDVDVKRWYPLQDCGKALEMKLYRNGRIDVKFTDAASAQAALGKVESHAPAYER